MSSRATASMSFETLRLGLRLLGGVGEMVGSFNTVTTLKSSGFFIGSFESAGSVRGIATDEVGCGCGTALGLTVS